MERVTKRIDENHACFAICEKECPDGICADNPACMCTAGREALKKLLEYEDAEEQEKLLMLPCKPGDTVYICKSVVNFGEMGDKSKVNYRIDKTNFDYWMIPYIGKSVFLTEQEALEGMKK